MLIRAAFILSILSYSALLAQPISQIKIGVNGMTCSACSRSVEMSLVRLKFVDSVSMDLENTQGIVHTKKLYPVDFEKIANAVTDAGFSMRSLEATLNFDDTAVGENGCFTLAGIDFQWIDYTKKSKNRKFVFMDPKFRAGKPSDDLKKTLNSNPCHTNKPSFHVSNAGN